MALFYFVVFFVTHDVFVGFCMGSSADLSAIGKKLPKRRCIFFTIVGVCICILELWEYGRNVRYENIDIVIACFAGIDVALTGIMCQGERENIVVFSDNYFEQVRKSVLSLEYSGPTELALVKTDEDTLGKIKPELQAFQERHYIDERYDSKVKSYYLKEDARTRLYAELNMRRVMTELLIPLFFMAAVLLIKIKFMTERTANLRRTEFLSCMGMRKKDRTSIMRHIIF